MPKFWQLFSNGLFPLNDPQQYNDYRYNEQEMDKPSGAETEKPNESTNDEYYCNDV